MIKIRRAFLALTSIASSILIGLNYLTVKTTSAIRAYINGESQYSKGQKDATNHLILYVYTKDPDYWQSFKTNISIPEGDVLAMETMLAKGSTELVKQGLLEGKNHPDNLDDMIWLFQNFRGISFMKRAIIFWADANALIGKLGVLGQSIHIDIENGSLSEEKTLEVLDRISAISDELTSEQEGFSAVMEASARKINWYFHVINSCIILTLICSIGWFVMVVFNRVAASKKLRNQIMNNSLDAKIWFDGNGVIQFWNPKAEQIFQWKREEVIGASVVDTIVPKSKRTKFIQNVLSYQKGGAHEGESLNQIVESVACDREGREFPIELSLINLERPHGMLFCAQVRDITERKKMEDHLHERKVYLQGILDSTNDGILAINNGGEVLGVNNRFNELWQIPDRLMTNIMDDQLMLHIVEQLEYPDNFQDRVMELQKSVRSDYEVIQLKNGRVFDRYSTPLILGEKIMGRVWSFRDVTEQLKSTISIRKAEERYRNLFEHSVEGIFMTSPVGKMLAINPAMARMYGYESPKEMIKSVTDIVGQLYADPKDQIEILNALKKSGSISGKELKAKKRNGEIFWVRCSMRATHDKSTDTKYMEGRIEDITESKVAEEQLLAQLDEVRKVNFELDRFVYSVSHDLRAPLASILGLVNIAEIDNPSPNQQDYLRMMRSSVGKLDKFIKDILDYSRNSRMVIQPVRVNFDDMIYEIQQNLSHMEGFGNITVNTEIDCSATFCSDEKRIEVIMYNLISNSIKYQDHKKDSYISVKIKTYDENVHITVADNGLGIDKKYIDKVFDMFFRASDHSTGAGLGLYILKETVVKLKGTVKVKSEKDQFTIFEISLPNLIEQSSLVQNLKYA